MSEPLREERRSGEDIHRRQSDVIAGETRQAVDDFRREWQEWKEEHAKRHDAQDARISGLETVKNKIEQPVKVIGWMVVVTLGGSLVYFGQKIAGFMEHHWH